jgi:hypothetical protein
MTGTVPEQPTQTSYAATADLAYSKTYYWRVLAADPTNVGPWSATLRFKTPDPAPVPTPPAPGPTPGPSPTSCSSNTPSSFNRTTAIFEDNPPIGRWAETSCITRVDFSSGYVIVDFDRRQGGGKWPEVPFGDGGGGTIQYTLGMCFYIQGQWHCSAAIQFWDGRELEAGGRMNEIGINWYYDGRWGIMAGYQPRQGELVAIFAANGNVRDSTNWNIEQRTNFLFIPYGTNYGR